MKKTKKQSNEKNKTIFIIIGAVVVVFLIYNLFLSPYQQCVRGYVNIKYDKERMEGYSKAEQRQEKNYHKSRAKVHCKALGR